MNEESQPAMDLAVERILLWQDFTQDSGYRDTLTLVHYPGEKYCYEFKVAGTVRVVPYSHFWKPIT